MSDECAIATCKCFSRRMCGDVDSNDAVSLDCELHVIQRSSAWLDALYRLSCHLEAMRNEVAALRRTHIEWTMDAAALDFRTAI